MQELSQQRSNFAATQPRRKRKATSVKKPMEFSKQLTMIDICCWAITTLLLLIVMLVQPSLASYCINIFNATTAAYVSLRLGYTAKAGIENYKKISSTVKSISYDDYYLYDEENSNG